MEEEVREGFLEEVKSAWQSDSFIPCAFPTKEQPEFPRWVRVPLGRQGSSDTPAALSFPSEGLSEDALQLASPSVTDSPLPPPLI